MHVCNYYLRFESTYGLYCSRCILKSRDYARVQLLSEIRIHLWALLQPLYSEISRLCNYYLRFECNYYLRFESTYGLYCSRCILKSREIMHVCNYYLRFESTYGLYCSRCILKSRDYARVQLLSEIRIHLWALLQPLYSEISRLCTCATTI
ncbi:hypothetical protein CDAR_373231 [Caerostris darwini]|uniref:Uncharacterized protein n=1 Tax=Caerostris darwini TaxID=1538125 RepID=A0AAV4XA19_9ARAC|nr:hypothetical protein CDAR_373231 [Caerostris darwini]